MKLRFSFITLILVIHLTSCITLIHENTDIHQLEIEKKNNILVGSAIVSYRDGLPTPFIVHSIAKCQIGNNLKISSRQSAGFVSSGIDPNEKTRLSFSYFGLKNDFDKIENCNIYFYSLQGIEAKNLIQSQFRKNIFASYCYDAKTDKVSKGACV